MKNSPCTVCFNASYCNFHLVDNAETQMLNYREAYQKFIKFP